MLKCGNSPIGVCSWSLQTDVPAVADALRQMNIEHIHLAVGAGTDPATGGEYLDAIKKQDWIVTSTMIDFPQEDYSSLDAIKVTGGVVQDDCWEANRQRFCRAVDITAELGVEYLSMHAGFIDESDPEYAKKISSRITQLADAAADKSITLLLETGQETAEGLKAFLEEANHPAIAVNFDPANMILYDKGNPVQAVSVLAPWIKHVHIKDAIRTTEPGTWGQEVPWGSGQVNTAEFLKALQEINYAGALAIEREAGDTRFDDIKLASELLNA